MRQVIPASKDTIVLCLALTLSVLGCTTIPFDTLSDLRQRYDLPPTPTALDYPDAEAVVLLSTTDTELYLHGESSEQSRGNLSGLRTDQVIHRITRVFKNLEARAVVEIDIPPGDRLVSFQAQILDPTGIRTVLTRADIGFGRVSATTAEKNSVDLESTHSDRNRNTLRFRFPNVQSGSILEYRYRLRRDAPYLYDSWAVQEYDPVAYTHYRLTVPRKLYGPDGELWEWRFRRYRCARIEAPRVYDSFNTELGVTTEYLWTHRDIAPLKPEPMMPPHQEYLRFVRFAHVGWEAWDAVTHWYSDYYLANAFIPSQEVAGQARLLTTGLKTEEERVEAVSQFVQSLETIHLMFGEGPLEPTTPKQTLAHARGDVKDKAILLVAMLRSLGMDADPALIVTSDRGPLDSRFPNWNFNHMLVLVNAATNPIWIDPTDRYSRFGELPWKCEGVEAVVIGPKGGATVLETPTSRHTDNRTLYDAQIVVQADSTAHVSVHLEFEGEPAAYASAATEKRGARELARELAATSYPDIELDRVEVTRSERGHLNLNFSFSTSTLLDTEDVLIRLQGNPLPFRTGVELMGEESRRYPLDCKFAATWIRTWTVDFSQSPFRIAAVPAPIDVENRILLYESRFDNPSPDRIEAHQILEIRNRRVLQRNYEEARLIAADLRDGGGRGVLLQAARK